MAPPELDLLDLPRCPACGSLVRGGVEGRTLDRRVHLRLGCSLCCAEMVRLSVSMLDRDGKPVKDEHAVITASLSVLSDMYQGRTPPGPFGMTEVRWRALRDFALDEQQAGGIVYYDGRSMATMRDIHRGSTSGVFERFDAKPYYTRPAGVAESEQVPWNHPGRSKFYFYGEQPSEAAVRAAARVVIERWHQQRALSSKNFDLRESFAEYHREQRRRQIIDWRWSSELRGPSSVPHQQLAVGGDIDQDTTGKPRRPEGRE